MSQTIYDTTPMRQVFKEGTWDVKLSFLVMGLANLVNKQFTKGLLFLLSEIAFLAAFVIQIIPALQGMITLGTQEQGEAIKEVNGIKLTVQVAGDNSMLMLIFGLASVIFCAVFAYIYWCNLKSLAISWLLSNQVVRYLTLLKTLRPWPMVASTWG